MKDIEDVKQLSDPLLDREIAKAVGYIPLSNAYDTYHAKHGVIPRYASNVSEAREAQAKAIELYPRHYYKNLAEVVLGTRGMCSANHIFLVTKNINKLLQATPRQISEAAYITIQEVKDNESTN